MKKLIFLAAAVCLSTFSSFAQYTFVNVSDLHISNVVAANSDYNAQYFRCAMNEFATLQPKPLFVVASGDISDMGNVGPEGLYPVLTQYLFPPTLANPGIGAYFIDTAQTIPVYFTPGNHEYWTGVEPNGIPISGDSLPYYTNYLTPDTDYVVTTPIAVIVFLRSGHDTPYTYGPDSIKGSGLSNAQCSWLRITLASHSDKRKIIVMHHPAVNVAGTNSDGTPFTGIISDTAQYSIQNNRTNFLNICDSNHVDVVLNGHEHQNVVANRKGDTIGENWPGGTRYVQTAAAFNRSYRVISVDPAFVSVGIPMRSCNSTFSVSEISTPLRITVSPNPATTLLTVECTQNARMEISTMAGHVIKTFRHAGQKTTVDLQNFPVGIYLLKVVSDRGSMVRKFSKQ